MANRLQTAHLYADAVVRRYSGLVAAHTSLYLLTTGNAQKGAVTSGTEGTWDGAALTLTLTGDATAIGSGILDHGHLISLTNATPKLMINDGFISNDFDGNWENVTAGDWLINHRRGVSTPHSMQTKTRQRASASENMSTTLTVIGPTVMTCKATISAQGSLTLKAYLDDVEKLSASTNLLSEDPTQWVDWSITIPSGSHVVRFTYAAGALLYFDDTAYITDIAFSANTFYDSKVSNGNKAATGTFSSVFTAAADTTYYTRAFVRTGGGIAYGDVVQITTGGATPTGYPHKINGLTVMGIGVGEKAINGGDIAGVCLGMANLPK